MAMPSMRNGSLRRGGLGIEEGMCLCRGGDAAGEEQLRQNLRQVHFRGEAFSFFMMRQANAALVAERWTAGAVPTKRPECRPDLPERVGLPG